MGARASGQSDASRAAELVPDGDDLAGLLQAARAADGATRITYRDPIARHGKPGIEALRDWLEPGPIGWFAVRTIGRAADLGAREPAIEALRAGVEEASGRTREDCLTELARLGVASTAARNRPPTGENVDHEPARVRGGDMWPGFQEHEFGQIAGTRWRERGGDASLAPIIVRALRLVHPHFQSYGIERRPEIHFALPERYAERGEHEQGFRAAKLVVYALGPTDEHPTEHREVVAGLYVEKGNGEQPYGELDDRWDWGWFLKALRDPAFQRDMSRVMARHGLTIGDRNPGPFSEVDGPIGWRGGIEDGALVLRNERQDECGRGWEAARRGLETLPSGTWHNLYVYRTWPDLEAIQGRIGFAFEQLNPVLVDLAAVYLRFVQHVIDPSGGRGWRFLESGRHDDGRRWIRYGIVAHQQGGHFNVPRAVVDDLGIQVGSDAELEVVAADIHFKGVMKLASGTEAYYRSGDEQTRGLDRIRPYEHIEVTVSRPAG